MSPLPEDLPAALTQAMDDLLAVLDLTHLGTARIRVEGLSDVDAEQMGDSEAEVFRGESLVMPHHRTFGGQVLAQSLVAAGRTVQESHPERAPHSLHAYFMRPGDDTAPIRFGVERMRDGRSFSTRRVHALQHGRPILSLTASFQDPADGLDHQDQAPAVPGPGELASVADVFAPIEHPRAQYLARRPVEHRYVEGHIVFEVPEPVARQHVWIRTVEGMPDDPLLHAAVLAYASDYTLLEPILRRHGRAWIDPTLRVASLDHAMWFHRPARVDRPLLYAQESPSAQGGRGLGLGRLFAEDGTLVATVAQEGMVRVKDDDEAR